MDNQLIATKFVTWEVPQLKDLANSKAYLLRSKLNRGNKMDRMEKNWLTKQVNSNAYFNTAVPLMGWKFDFSDVLKRFLVRQYGKWEEYVATDITSLRSILYGKVDKIVIAQRK